MTPTEHGLFAAWRPGLWRFRVPQGRRLIAGVTDRSINLDELRTRLGFPHELAAAEQVHGVSLAAVHGAAPRQPIPGCDGILTATPDLLLTIRTADCLPILGWDPLRNAISLIHAGWRGLAGDLPAPMVTRMRQLYRSRPEDLWVAIGPAIRACCYEVGPEFAGRFGRFVSNAGGRRHCDLIGYAIQQLCAAGIRAGQIVDSGQCTSCDASQWYSFRREGAAAGRLLSFAVVHPSG